jgi:hypothetical protein
MQSNAVLDEAFSRIPWVVRRALEGIDPAALTWRVEPEANTIGWLVWHLTRIQDDHVADIAKAEQVWLTEDWAGRFGLSEATPHTGHQHTPEEVATIRPEGTDALLGYLDRVTERTRDFLTTIGDDDLDRVIDRSWDPPVTMGVRLVSVIADNLQHAGQTDYLRGIYDRTR